MFKCLCPGAIGIGLPWEACLPLAKAAGFTGIDVPIGPDASAACISDMLAEAGLQPGGWGLLADFRQDDATFAEGLRALDKAAAVAAAVGAPRCSTWILSYSDTLPLRENLRFHAERLGQAAKVLADHGCRLGLEFLGPKTFRAGHKYPFIRTMEQMLDLCALVGPNAGLLLDSWHWYTSLGTLEDLLTLTPADIVYVHINDAPAGIPVDQQVDTVRCIPGESGVIDLPGFLHALRTIGYDGPVVPEPFVPELRTLPPAQAAQRVGDGLNKVWSLPVREALPATMQVVATGGGKAWLVEQPVPRPQGNEVVVKLYAAPICGSNMPGFHAEGACINAGHEGAGEVVAVAQSTRLTVGDRVVLAPLNACGRCPDCRNGDTIFCTQRPPVHGDFAQYTRVADVNCALIPPDIDYLHASLLGCCLGPASEAIKRLAVKAFDTVVITGLGPVGLGATALAAFLNARVIAIDPEPYRRELAAHLGATLTLDSNEPELGDILREITGGRGISKGIDCSGKESAERLLIEQAAIRGTIAFIGENGGTIPLSPSNDFIRKGLTVIGCWHMNMHDVPALFEFLRRAPEKADLLVTHYFGFGQLQQAFDTFASRQSAKVILLPWGEDAATATALDAESAWAR